MRIDKIEMYRVCNPIKRPYITAFGSQNAFNSIVVKLESDGIAGWGESCPGGGPFFSCYNDKSCFSIAKDFVMVDFELACIQGAKLLAMDAVSLLGSNAEKAKAIASLPKIMDKKTYFEYKELLSSSEEFDYDQA